MFLVFAGDACYPEGPCDYQGSRQTLQEAKDLAIEADETWYAIYDGSTGALVEVSGDWFRFAEYPRVSG
jgi:hypothetical protein